VSGTFGIALAWIVVEPAAPPAIGTTTLVAFARTVTVAGTVATPVLSELRFTVTPPTGAGADRFSVRRSWVVAAIVTLV
jgi:hypothetical protein